MTFKNTWHFAVKLDLKCKIFFISSINKFFKIFIKLNAFYLHVTLWCYDDQLMSLPSPLTLFIPKQIFKIYLPISTDEKDFTASLPSPLFFFLKDQQHLKTTLPLSFSLFFFSPSFFLSIFIYISSSLWRVYVFSDI